MTCKCGEPSIARKFQLRYTKKDGTISIYNVVDKRCKKCSHKKRTTQVGQKSDRNYAY